MASGTYNRWRYNLMMKLVNMDTDTFYVELLDTDHAFDPDHDVIGDVDSNEINPGSANGYLPGGALLPNPTVAQDDTNNCATFDADNVVWSSATFSAYHAVIYDTSVTDNLVASIDFGGVKTVAAGTFTISWHINGIIRLS